MATTTALDINLLLRVIEEDSLEQMRTDFPHIFFPQHFLNPWGPIRELVFEEVSLKLLTLYWVFSENKKRLSDRAEEAHRKEDIIFFEIHRAFKAYARDYPDPDFPEPERLVDRKFDDVRELWFQRAKQEAKEYDPERWLWTDLSETPIRLHSALNTIEQSIEQMNRENLFSAFIGLRRTLLYGLERIIKLAAKYAGKEREGGFVFSRQDNDLRERSPDKLPNWNPVPRFKGEAEYVWLLRSLSRNYSSLDNPEFHRFSKGNKALKQLNKARNRIEHGTVQEDDQLTYENLLQCFHEVSTLFEYLENDRNISVLVNGFAADDIDWEPA